MKKQTQEERAIECAKVEADMIVFGTGFLRKHDDGRLEYLPIQQVHVYTKATK